MLNKDHQIKKLIEVNDELENYFKNTIIPQLYIDADLILQKFTPPAMKQFSLSANDIGKPISDIKDNFRFPTIINNIQQVIDCNEILEKEIQTTDFRWFQMNIIPYVISKTNKTNGVIITFVEITMRIKDLKEQEKLISDYDVLLDTISHDIKTPLTSLILTINLLKKTTPPDSSENFLARLKVIENGIRKMQHVIVELTDVRKQEHINKAEEELLSFENILEDVRLLIAGHILETGAVIKSEINVSEITFSRRKLRSIIYNLVNNAIKYSPHDRSPEIFVKTISEENFVVISVKDNGVGIDESKHEEVFSKYFRIDNAKANEGSGVGLYLVNEIVKNAGGKILLESEPGKGSEFKVYLKVV